MTTGMVVGECYERTACVFLRQITGEDGSLISSLDIAAITYDVYKVSMTRERYIDLFGGLTARDVSLVATSAAFIPEPITYGRELNPSECVLDDPLRDDRWSIDPIVGFNFIATLGPSDFPEIPLDNYPVPEWQEVWFNLTPYVGSTFRLGYVLKKLFTLGDRKSGSGSGSGV